MSAQLPPPRNLGYVAAGGALGAVARVALAVGSPTPPGAFPWVTFLENVTGAFLLAWLLTLLTERLALDPTVRLLLCTGALGAFTTYSTLAVEVDGLLRTGAGVLGGVYAVTSVALGLAAALLGIRLARWRPRAAGGRGTAGPGTGPAT